MENSRDVTITADAVMKKEDFEELEKELEQNKTLHSHTKGFSYIERFMIDPVFRQRRIKKYCISLPKVKYHGLQR